MELRIGTSGWHYPGGRGTWDGIFYPRPADRARGFDELRFYAERFNTVEVNSTFYGQPRASVSLGWVRRTPPGFEFSVKLFQKFTHPATAAGPDAGHRRRHRRVQGRHRAAGGRRQARRRSWRSSRRASTTRRRRASTWRGCSRHSATIPSRSSSVTARGATPRRTTEALLAAQAAAWVQIDEPKFESSIRQASRPELGPA